MTCAIKECKAAPTRADDVFCAAHWKTLPRWVRVELVHLRNTAARGNQSAVRDFLKGAAVAKTLVTVDSL